MGVELTVNSAYRKNYVYAWVNLDAEDVNSGVAG